MSSFFANNAISANNHEISLAFFIPQGTFQQNDQIQDIRLMKPRYGKTEAQKEQSEEIVSQQQKSQQTTTKKRQQRIYSKVPSIPQKQISTTTNVSTKKSSIQAGAKTNTTRKQQNTKDIRNTEITEVAPSTTEYQLDDNKKKQSKTTSAPRKTVEINIKDLQQKSLKELLAEIPYPDSHQPKFKQLYGLYGLELRSFQRRGKFPSNRDQEDALAKANSIKKFTIQ